MPKAGNSCRVKCRRQGKSCREKCHRQRKSCRTNCQRQGKSCRANCRRLAKFCHAQSRRQQNHSNLESRRHCNKCETILHVFNEAEPSCNSLVKYKQGPWEKVSRQNKYAPKHLSLFVERRGESSAHNKRRRLKEISTGRTPLMGPVLLASLPGH